MIGNNDNKKIKQEIEEGIVRNNEQNEDPNIKSTIDEISRPLSKWNSAE